MHLHNKKLISTLVTLSLICASSVVLSTEIEDREQAAKQASLQLIKQLGSTLKKEMKNHGAEAAISVCRDLAPKISGEISRKNGWQVTRVSQKVRNPLLGIPDAWEHKVLTDFETRKKRGEKYSEMTFSETVEESGVHYYRFMKAIGTKPVCLSCHGNSDKIPDGLKAKLNADYPMDQALGYQVGELRGAVSIKQPMAIPLPR
ncbi:MAG: DUF3365 domain-containing protein [Gammaproteobacteria bacterium]|nr:DUF3365 domain-containing protein [Gammaproteobacteria bacterium]